MDTEAEKPQRPRILIVQDFSGNYTGFYCDGAEPLDIVIATRRKDGLLTGRPVSALAVPDVDLVSRAFERADSPEARGVERVLDADSGS